MDWAERSDVSARSLLDSERETPNDAPTTSPPHSPSPAASIKDYSLQAFLGEGSTAHVYLATRIDDHEPMAIKVIDKLLVRQAQMEHKVQREVLLHSPLRHRHVVRVRGTFEDPRNHYIALEYCSGGSVATLVRRLREKRRTMDETVAKKIFRQTALGVAYLHERGIIHRDLKLSNLLLTEDGEVKISDFGLATLMSDDHATVCGTPNYIAPEVLSAGESTTYDHTADIWSLGCILYTLMLGKPPFEGQKVSETLANVTNAGQQPLHFPRGFSATVGDLIKRLLSRDAQARPKIAQVLSHPWLRSVTRANINSSTRTSVREPRSSSHMLPKVSTNMTTATSRGQPRKSCRQSRTPLDYESDESSFNAALDFNGRGGLSDATSSDESGVANSDVDDFRLESEELLSSSHASATSEPAAVGQGLSILNDAEDTHRPKGDVYSGSRMLSTSGSVGASISPQETKIPSQEVHFLRMQIEVSDLPFLKIDPGTTKEIVWDCWETSDVRQLTRFKLQMGRSEIEYTPSKALIQGTLPTGSTVRHFCDSTSSSCQAQSAVNDDTIRLVRLCQCLASRSLQVRRAAMAIDIDKLPIVHFDRLPEFLLESLRRETVRSAVNFQLGNDQSQLSVNASGRHIDRVRCVVPGIGFGEFDNEGRLMIQFFSGTVLQMNASGSKIRYRRSPSVGEDEFDLAVSPFLPTEVKKHFEHVPTFVRELQS